MEKDKIIEKIRSSCSNLSNAIMSNKVDVIKSERVIVFYLISDKTFTEEDVKLAESIIAEKLTVDLKVKVNISKVNPDLEMFTAKLKQIIKTNFPALDAILGEENIFTEKTEKGFDFTFKVDELELQHIKSSKIFEQIIKILNNTFCGEFNYKYELVGKVFELKTSNEDIEKVKEEREIAKIMQARTFEVVDIENIDGGNQSPVATCIIDCNNVCDALTVCGVIRRIEERQTQNGKPFFSIVINDGTADLKITYWVKQKSLLKVQELKEGDSIVCFGANELYNGNLSYKAKYINKGRMIDGYTMPKRASLPVPVKYKTIFPQQFKAYTQNSLFENINIPEVLRNKTFVAFDLETTGLCNTPVSGNMDTIIEFGAVKIVDGEICEKFSTLINPKRKLSAKIVELTNITDDMLKDAPLLDAVMPDFFKFVSGSYLIGHNAMFDYKFVSYYAEQQGYIFTNKLFDTLAIAQKKLQLSNNKLDTIADHYGITFEHHRAFDDALTTAKIFIEFMRDEKKLPNSLVN